MIESAGVELSVRFAASAHAEKGSNREVADLSQSSSTSSVQARSPVTRSAMHKAVDNDLTSVTSGSGQRRYLVRSDEVQC